MTNISEVEYVDELCHDIHELAEKIDELIAIVVKAYHSEKLSETQEG